MEQTTFFYITRPFYKHLTNQSGNQWYYIFYKINIGGLAMKSAKYTKFTCALLVLSMCLTPGILTSGSIMAKSKAKPAVK